MSIEVQGLEAINKSLTFLRENLSDSQMTKKLNTIGGMVLNSIEDSFDQQTSPFGEKWTPLKIKTVHQSYGKSTHTKKGVQTKGFLRFVGDRKILHDTGALSERWRVQASPTQVIVFGAGVSRGYEYGKAHQYGTKHIKARPFLPIDTAGHLELGLLKSIEDYLEDEISKALK